MLSNNRFEFIHDHIRGREVVMDTHMELLNQCIEVKKNKSIKKSDEIVELVDLLNIEIQKTSNENNNIKIKSNVQDDLYSLSHQYNKLGNVIVDKPIKVLVSS